MPAENSPIKVVFLTNQPFFGEQYSEPSVRNAITNYLNRAFETEGIWFNVMHHTEYTENTNDAHFKLMLNLNVDGQEICRPAHPVDLELNLIKNGILFKQHNNGKFCVDQNTQETFDAFNLLVEHMKKKLQDLKTRSVHHAAPVFSEQYDPQTQPAHHESPLTNDQRKPWTPPTSEHTPVMGLIRPMTPSWLSSSLSPDLPAIQPQLQSPKQSPKDEKIGELDARPATNNEDPQSAPQTPPLDVSRKKNMTRESDARQATNNVGPQSAPQTPPLEESPKERMVRELRAYANSESKRFLFSNNARTIHSKLNRETADALADALTAETDDRLVAHLISPANVLLIRRGLINDYRKSSGEKNYPEQAAIHSQTLNAVLDAGRTEFKQANDFESRKREISTALSAYISRAGDDFKHGFSFFVASRALNRETNVALAKHILDQLKTASEHTVASLFESNQLKEMRLSLVPKDPNYRERGMNSAELNTAFALGRSLFPKSNSEFELSEVICVR